MEYRIPLDGPLDARPRYFWVGEKLEIVVFRDGDRIRALSSICPHMGAQMGLDARARRARCPWHGLSFDLEGRCSSHAKYPRLREFSARVREGELVLEG